MIEVLEFTLALRLEVGLRTIPGATVHGVLAHERRVPTYVPNVEVVEPLSVSNQLVLKNICAWSGNYYAVKVMERLGLGITDAVRLGFVHYPESYRIPFIKRTSARCL
jgi:selenocysteine lyase/cysteine desulfurase